MLNIVLFYISAITMWITSSIDNSERRILTATYELCIPSGNLRTSVLLQMMTGTFGLTAFILACLLIHIAVTLNAHLHAQNNLHEDVDDIFDFEAKMDAFYPELYKSSKVRHI